MNLQETYKLRYQDPDFKGRVVAAIARVAQGITNEDPATPNHVNRLNYAQMWFAQLDGVAEGMLWSVVNADSIQATGTASDDATIQAVVDPILIAQTIPPAA